jgi:hypothetical protein
MDYLTSPTAERSAQSTTETLFPATGCSALEAHAETIDRSIVAVTAL